MAKVKIEGIIDHLDSEIRQALESAVEETIPSATFDAYALFRAFQRAIDRKCSTWERVPDHYIDMKN